MKNRFFKNVAYMSFGRFFELFIGFVSIIVYIKSIGISGYAILGIVFSFLNIIYRFDIPYFLSLVKYNSDYYKNKKNLFESVSSTMYNSVLLSNIIFFLLLSFLTMFLSIRIYNNKPLILFYFMAIFIFMFGRTNSFLNCFIRANKREIIIQKARIPSVTIEFLLTIVLMFIFNLGVLSIFIGIFVGNVFEYLLLNHYVKEIVNFKPKFSLSLLIKIFKKYTFQNYISSSLRDIMLRGGLFISTFYLDTITLGILTIIISIQYKIQELYSPFIAHITPLYSYELVKKNYNKVRKIMKNTTTLLFAFNMIVMMLLLTAGKYVYSSYVGSDIYQVYFIFILITAGTFLPLSFSAVSYYFFVSDIKLCNKIVIFLTLVFFILLFPIGSSLGLIGGALTYLIVCCLRLGILLFFINRRLKKTIDADILILLCAVLAYIIMTIVIYGAKMPSILILALLIIITSMILLRKVKKLINIIKYIVFEM